MKKVCPYCKTLVTRKEAHQTGCQHCPDYNPEVPGLPLTDRQWKEMKQILQEEIVETKRELPKDS